VSEAVKGIVYLIGAGPGDPDLITVKGKKLLQACNVVLYDNLIPEELVATLPVSVEKIFVGKKAGQACYSQDEINRLLVRLAREGRRVARLKGSDPLIFGRGAEEAKYLKESEVRFEIIPGVTSGIAALAYAGIPCTDRNLASFVLFVTGHKAREKEISSVRWDWVAGATDGTIVIYMGVREIENIVRQLIDHGLPGNTLAAVIERGTLPSQRVFETTLRELPETVAQHRVRPPALFVLGDVVNSRSWLKWFEGRPLTGIRVMVTRPADQAGEMYQSLRDRGAEVQAYPTIATAEQGDPEIWSTFESIDSDQKWLIFTSENGVRYFMNQYLSRYGDIRRLSDFKIAVVGYGTTRALRKFELAPDFIPSRATTPVLAEQLVTTGSWTKATVWRVRGNLSNEVVDKKLAEAGARVFPVNVYKTFFPEWPDGLKEKLFEYPPDVITFTSGSSVNGFINNLSKSEIEKITEGTTFLSIGPMTTQVALENGLKVTLEAGEHSIPAMINTLVKAAEKGLLRKSL